MCQEEPDHLGRGIRTVRIGVAADRVPAEPGVPGVLHQPMLGDDRSRRVGVGGLGVRPVPGAACCRLLTDRTPPAADPAETLALMSFSALIGATVESPEPWKAITGTRPDGTGLPPLLMAPKADGMSWAER